MTDVTGFGLLGHGLEMARGSGVSLDIAYDAHPVSRRSAEALAEAGYATGASGRNWASYGDEVVLPAELPAMAADAADRSADVGRPAHRLRRRARRRHPQHDRSGRLSERSHHRLGHRRGTAAYRSTLILAQITSAFSRRCWRRRVGVEPTWDRLAAPLGFEVRTPHRGRFSSVHVSGRMHEAPNKSSRC